MRFSVIVPVYNRPDEVDELLQSLTEQNSTDFETIIVEDGSTQPCKEIVDKYKGKLQIHYFFIKNSGPAGARNYGIKQANGEYIIFFDSDCIIPSGYFQTVEKAL